MTEKTIEKPIQKLNGIDYMPKPNGSLVPVDNIKASDLERDEFVREVAGQWMSHSESLAKFKDKVMGDIMAFSQLAAEKYDVQIGSIKGNYTLTTFDGEYKLKISVGDIKDVNENFYTSKELINEYINGLGSSADPNLMAIIDAVYQTNDKGNVNLQMIFKLMQANVHDPSGKWDKAMALLKESIIVTDSKPYVRLYKRNDVGKYDNVPLDIAVL